MTVREENFLGGVQNMGNAGGGQVFEHDGRKYRDCWIETSVKHRGCRSMSGLYVAGHYVSWEAACAALAELLQLHPKAFAFITLLPA